MADEMAELVVRYEAGIGWLKAHDPTGSFYFWFVSGIRPHHPMPAQDEPKREAYAEYFKAYTLWLVLDKKLLKLEKAAAAAAKEGVPA
jgi:hypothetical protein